MYEQKPANTHIVVILLAYTFCTILSSFLANPDQHTTLTIQPKCLTIWPWDCVSFILDNGHVNVVHDVAICYGIFLFNFKDEGIIRCKMHIIIYFNIYYVDISKVFCLFHKNMKRCLKAEVWCFLLWICKYCNINLVEKVCLCLITIEGWLSARTKLIFHKMIIN